MSSRIVVSGMVAGIPWQGGATWAIMQHVLGLRALGHDVWLVEPATGAVDVTYAQLVIDRFGLAGRAALVDPVRRASFGVPYDILERELPQADVHLNVSGMLEAPALVGSIACRVYLDLDPGFVQLWHAVDGIDMHFDGHTHFATVGLSVGRSSTVPTCGVRWIHTLPPVHLPEWPRSNVAPRPVLTTVANWRSYGSISHGGVRYGQKAHSFRHLVDLPAHVEPQCEVALAIDAGDDADRQLLRRRGWHLVDPRASAGTPDTYAEYVNASLGEIAVAKEGYVVGRTGWFSDRSACYLAAGRPVVASDTGIGTAVPSGAGFVTFTDVVEASAAVEEVVGRYDHHAAAARAFAEDLLDARHVLTRLLERVASA